MVITGKLPLPQPLWNPFWKNPFTNKPQLPDAQFSADIDYWKLNSSKLPSVKIVDDECNLGVNVSAVGGVFKSVGVSVIYRNSNAKCNPPPPPKPVEKPPDPPHQLPPPSPPPPPDTKPVPLPPDDPIAICPGGTCYATYAFWREFNSNSYVKQGSGGNVLEPYLTGKGSFPKGWTECSRGTDKGCAFIDIDKRKPEIACQDDFTGLEIATYTINYSGDAPPIKIKLPNPLNNYWDDVPDSLPPWKLIATGCINCTSPPPDPPKPPPPPPPKKRCCNDMCCCNDNGKNENNNDLLRALLAKVKKLSEILGVNDYPASLPNSFITKSGNHPGNTNIPNLTQMLGWYFERFDEVIGQFEVDIDVKLPNDETESIHLPNIAESIGEIVTMLFHQTYNSELLVNICNRVLIEAGQNKQQGFKVHQALHSVIDYLGFAYNEQSENMPLSFKPGETSFQKMLKETEVPVSVVEYDGKQQGLHPVLLDLLQAAAIIRAAHWKQLNPNGDLASQLISTIKLAKDVKDALHKHDDCLDLDVEKLETLENGTDSTNS